MNYELIIKIKCYIKHKYCYGYIKICVYSYIFCFIIIYYPFYIGHFCVRLGAGAVKRV